MTTINMFVIIIIIVTIIVTISCFITAARVFDGCLVGGKLLYYTILYDGI